MATALEPRRIEDLEQDAVIAVEQEWQRRSRGAKPWTPTEYVNEIEKIHARYAAWRLVLKKWQAA